MLSAMFDKSVASERLRIEELMASMESRVRRAFAEYVQRSTSEAVLRQVREALERRDISLALEIASGHAVLLGDVITGVFTGVARAEVAALGNQIKDARVSLSFDPSYPRAATIMRQNRLSLVSEFTEQQRQVTRRELVGALQRGDGMLDAARAFRNSIGLTSSQLDAVANYRRLLESGDKQALNRTLRDARFDGSVARAARDNEPLGAEKINRMVERYRARTLAWRAETIARTETIKTLNQARQEALSQVVEQASIAPTNVSRTWRSTRDMRVRDTHAAMDGQQRGMREPFVSPSGARLMTPGDPSLGAPGSEIINCRCVLLTIISRS